MKKWRVAWWMHRWMKGSSFAQYCIKQIQWWSKVSLTVDSGFITFKFMKVSLWFCMKQFCLTHLSDLQLLSKTKPKLCITLLKTQQDVSRYKTKKKITRAVPQKWTVKVFLSGIVHIEIDLTYVGSLDNTSRVASWLAEHEQPVKRSLILKIYLSGHKSRLWQKWQFSHFSFKLNGLYY